MALTKVIEVVEQPQNELLIGDDLVWTRRRRPCGTWVLSTPSPPSGSSTSKVKGHRVKVTQQYLTVREGSTP